VEQLMPLLRVFGLVISLILFTSIIPKGMCLALESMTAATPELDQISSDCISCHNGSDGTHAGFCLLSQKGERDGHIISASYAVLAGQNKGLCSESNLPSETVLYEGEITCVTCHGSDPHNGQTTVIDNRGSALCRTCHLK